MNRMKALIVLSAAAAILGAAPAGAREGDFSVDASVAFATEPTPHVGETVGLSLGATYEMANGIQVREDISRFHWSRYDRLPLNIAVGKVLGTTMRELNVFGQAGLEISFDEVKKWATPSVSYNDQDINLGLTLGVGAEYAIDKNFFLRGGVKYHIIRDSYATITTGVGYRF